MYICPIEKIHPRPNQGGRICHPEELWWRIAQNVMGGYRPTSPHTGRQLNSLEMRYKHQGRAWGKGASMGCLIRGKLEQQQRQQWQQEEVIRKIWTWEWGREKEKRRGRREKVASQFIHLYIHRLAAFWLGKERPQKIMRWSLSPHTTNG